jgi:hypothetical protein
LSLGSGGCLGRAGNDGSDWREGGPRRTLAAVCRGPSSVGARTLRQVTYRLKTDPGGALQYGLIAEELASVDPELVVRDDDGRIGGVRYDRLAPILLNEVQQQQQQLVELKRQFAEL